MGTTVLRLQAINILLGTAGIFAYAASKFTPGRSIVFITATSIPGFLVTLILLALKIKGFWKVIRVVSISLLAAVAGAYLLLFAGICFFQDAIANGTSSFFQPRTISADASRSLLGTNVTELDLTTPEGIHLRGWLVRNSTGIKAPLVIYFGGSGSESSELIPLASQLNGWSVALVNYRGFGLSEGTPTHKNALEDALFIYDELTARDDVDPARVVPMGYSLGTGVAVYLSAQRPVAGTILVAPYDRWSLVGLKTPPIYAPLESMLKPYFDSLSLAPGIRAPMLCLTGSKDGIVPPGSSLKLVTTWGGDVTHLIYPEEDHGLLFHDNSSWSDLLKFLQGLGQQ